MSKYNEWPDDWNELQEKARLRLLRERARRQAVVGRGERGNGVMVRLASVQRLLPAVVVVLVIALVGLGLRDRWLSGGRKGVLSGLFEKPIGGSDGSVGVLSGGGNVVEVRTPVVPLAGTPVIGMGGNLVVVATPVGFQMVSTGMPFQHPP